MNYCTYCAHALKLVQLENETVKRYYCENCGSIHYTNPKMVVGCLAYWEDQVLLCKRAIEPFKGKWNIPAGYLEKGETAEEGAKRETWEEAYANVEVHSVHAIYSLTHINQIYIHFLGELQNLDYASGTESSEVALFKEEEIPWEDLAFSSSSFALEQYFKDRRRNYYEPHIGSFIQYRNY